MDFTAKPRREEMTLLQRQIREAITSEGYIHIRVGRSSPATMNTIKSLKRANYRCARVGKQDDHDVWLISL